MASAPSSRSSATSAWPRSSRRPATTTCAPSCAKMNATARPMPVRAPVINTTGELIALPPSIEEPCRPDIASRVQEQRRVFDEELRVLVLRSVIGVGVNDQLRIRDVLLHDERVDRGHDHVVTAVHDECWLRDRLQIVVGPLALDTPLAHRFDLGGRHLVVHFGIAPLLTKMRAPQALPPRRLACLGRTELDREPDVLGRIVGGAEEPPCSRGQRLHALTTARTVAQEAQFADEIG